MNDVTKGSKRSVRHATAVAVALGFIWVAFVAVSLSEFVTKAWAEHTPDHIGGRNVVIGGVLVGRVELYRLIGGRGLNVYFHPANGDLNVINQYGLNWWQAVNRPQEPGVADHIDTLNVSTGLPGVPPGDDNDPSYYTNAERTPHVGPPTFNPNQIFAGGNWWMVDFPGDHINIRFETWLVSSGGQGVQRHVCFNWGFADGGGVVTNTGEPSFINDSVFNLADLLNISGFGPNWQISGPSAGLPPEVVPTLSQVGMAVLLILLLLAGSLYVLRGQAGASTGR